ncbi:dehalogenase-like hydrolase domain-containing protein At4g39970 [Seminavis robusta]|uniref:Dehalogenase-like hydrolase domain-containing protein At4g39970 n=1 Tax=Seminavis robusta TaxID=568900 RepID=A0A9N8DSF2_9STRA|nr:dehalogenase-like hydrolase domain-containing protein At4g39970 [Seminavis robusta]|eukprot:Sro246_g097880.1 dehalogenase-like hydrolase domain-containing protein At4g39970 (319) ;mRNA; r:78000-79230
MFRSKQFCLAAFCLWVSAVQGFAPVFRGFRFQSQRLLQNNAAPSGEYEYALLFDCDGVILETEEFHRQAYNGAFEAAELTIDGEPVVWSVEYYDVLQNTVGGGKPKMFFHFRNTTKAFPMSGQKPAPVTLEEQQALIDALQTDKTGRYKKFVEENAVCRPGVLELMDEALANPMIAVGVCSASTKEAAQRTLSVTLGQERIEKLDVCILGDDVSEKKPSPMIYNEAAKRIGVPADRCVVIEDSLIGLQAAKGANMKCVITYTGGTKDEDFYGEGADAKVPNLGSRGVTLASIFDPIMENGSDAELMVGLKDPPAVPAA